jgi:branched-chain amino acid transport system permease protein
MAVATGVYHTTYRADLAVRQTCAEHVRLGLLVLLLVALPFALSPFWLTVVNQIGVAVVGAIGLNILVGHTGLISLGQGAFLAVGAYTSAILATRAGLPTLVAMAAAVAVTAAVGAFFGLPSLRLKGLYLAMATLAAQFIILFAIRNWEFVTGGVDAVVVEPPVLFGYTLRSDFAWYWVIMGVAALAAIAATNLFRTGLGRAFHAIRDQDIAAAVMGIEVGRYKVLAFAISSGFVGLGGALTAHYRTIVTWERVTIETSILYLAMIIIGGLGTISGSFFGAAFILLLPAMINTIGRALQDMTPGVAAVLPAVQQATFGIVIILFLVLEPRGLAKLWRNVKDYFRVWPFSY